MRKIHNILKNIFYIKSSFLYLLVRGKAIKIPKDVNSVLVVQNAKMGDMVCSTPVMHAFRVQFPSAHITVLGDSIGKQILEGNSDVDDYLISKQNFFTLLRLIRQTHFDASVVLVPDARAVALSFLGGVKIVIAPSVIGGFCPWMTKTYRILLYLVQNVSHKMGHYAPREYLRLLEPFGIYTNDTKKYLSYSDSARKNASAFLRAHNLIENNFAIISPSAGNKIKNWQPDRFAKVAEYIANTKNIPVVVIGGPRDTKEVADMMRSIKTLGNIINASEKFSIEELKAFIAKAKLFISVDTGTIYVAEAFGVPTIDIIGPIDEHEQPPIGKKHEVVVPKRIKPELHVMNARVYNKKEARRQIESISVKEVCSSVDTILKDI